jgi:hypothetical protein
MSSQSSRGTKESRAEWVNDPKAAIRPVWDKRLEAAAP